MIDVAQTGAPAAAAGRNGAWQAREMKWRASELERTFRDCFFEQYATTLEGGGREPVYVPSSDPAREPHRIVYREDYFASALHEVAHWCLAGAARRALEDYGYWYRPDGRNLAEQVEFERAETRPQAVEWIFADACGFPFHLSADNLTADLAGGFAPSGRFEAGVLAAKADFLAHGLPARAGRFLTALRARWGSLIPR